MNGYKAFYKSKQLDIYANSSYEAQKFQVVNYRQLNFLPVTTKI